MIPDSKLIEKRVLKKITPTKKEKEHIEHVISLLKERVRQEIKKTGISITLQLVGSTAKDTYVRTSVDIDLFLVFPTTVSREKLEEKGLRIGRAILTHQEECFAEHPYVRGVFKGVKTELVPCYKIEKASQKLSAVDRTPLHTTYVRDHLRETQKNEVRLLKQFLKGIGCYGAEAEIEGFSGYLCEILILQYKTFQRLIEQVPTWRYGEKLTLKKGISPEFTTALVFIDPVDPNRNVASALSKEKFDLFVCACRDYKQNPRITFFFPHTIHPWSLKKIQQHLEPKEFIGVRLPKPRLIAENLYPQIRKAMRAIRELCEQYDFTILDATYFVGTDYVYIIFQPKTRTLPKIITHAGPPVHLKKNAEKFIKKWQDNSRTTKKPYEKDKRLYVEIEREYTDITTLLHHQVKQLSLGKNIDSTIIKKLRIVEKNDLLKDNLRPFWTIYLDPRKPWER
jgi:tRNA nucleotidyltransferase (CCA-adding enzyme)